MALRDCNVTHRREAVWTIREYVDLYSGDERVSVEAKRPQVDHIWEIQMLEYVYKEDVLQDAPLAARTRLGHKQFKKVRRTMSSAFVLTVLLN